MTVKRLIGSNPSQVSRNRDLGTMAFQNKENVQIGNIGAATDVVTLGNGQVTKDASGNLGLGVTPSAWATVKAFQVNNGSVYGYSTAETGLTGNAYYNAGWKYIATGYATKYTQGEVGNGIHAWYTAPSGTAGSAITFTQAMTLDASGRLGIGLTSPNCKLAVGGTNTNDTTANAINIARFSDGRGGAIMASYRTDLSTPADTLMLAADSTNPVDLTKVKYRLDAVGQHIWYGTTTSTERMRIDSSGNLGLGVTPSAWNYGGKGIDFVSNGFVSSANNAFSVLSNAYYNGTAWTYKASSTASWYLQTNGQHHWYTAPSGTAGNAISFTQAMTLDASGNLLVGTTTFGQPDINGAAIGKADGSIRSHHATGTASGAIYSYFTYGGLGIGSISQNGTTAVAYNTSSDYRLKENIQPMQNALYVVAQLNPVTYTWKADGSDGQGFIAHELQAVVPDCVTGEKDAVDEDGKPVYQGVDTSFLVATLTKAIQEQQEQINQLKAEVAALKVN